MQTNEFELGDTLLREKRAGSIDSETTTPEPRLKAFDVADFLRLDFPPRSNVVSPWLPSQGLVMVYAPRGVGKTYFALNLSIAITSGGEYLGWKATEPRGVLYLDGEMPATVMQERLSAIILSAEKEPTSPLRIITPDLQPFGMPNLATSEGQDALEPLLEGIEVVIVDNISTLCRGGRENEAESWLPVQEWALRMRSRGTSVVFIHHAGKGGNQRGTSRREDVLDTVISLRHPGDYRPEEGARFEVHFEKSRGIHGDDVKPFEAQLISSPDGGQIWVVKSIEDSLTERVARLLNDGVPQVELAEELGVSKGTISKHKKKAQELGLIVIKGGV